MHWASSSSSTYNFFLRVETHFLLGRLGVPASEKNIASLISKCSWAFEVVSEMMSPGNDGGVMAQQSRGRANHPAILSFVLLKTLDMPCLTTVSKVDGSK